MRTFIVAAVIALLTVPAYSQVGGGGMGGGMGRGGGGGGGKGAKTSSTDSAASAAKKKAEDKAFNDAVKRIPNPEKKFDPWGGVRTISAK
jgi:hypothetical protein